MTTADRLWEALCEMKESEGVVLKDHFTRRVTEILAAEQATVEIKPAPKGEPKTGKDANGEAKSANPVQYLTLDQVATDDVKFTILRGGHVYDWNMYRQEWVLRR